eukprot:881519-Amphidinium_carterae.1
MASEHNMCSLTASLARVKEVRENGLYKEVREKWPIGMRVRQTKKSQNTLRPECTVRAAATSREGEQRQGDDVCTLEGAVCFQAPVDSARANEGPPSDEAMARGIERNSEDDKTEGKGQA